MITKDKISKFFCICGDILKEFSVETANVHKLKLHTWIKLCIAVLMILCLLPMPYGFYNLVHST